MEKLTPEESVKGGNTSLRGSVRAPKGFSKSQPKAAKLTGARTCASNMRDRGSVTKLSISGAATVEEL